MNRQPRHKTMALLLGMFAGHALSGCSSDNAEVCAQDSECPGALVCRQQACVDANASASSTTSSAGAGGNATGGHNAGGSGVGGTGAAGGNSGTGGSALGSLTEVLSSADFEQMFLHVSNPACKGANLYTYQALVSAAADYPTFATSGDLPTRQREVAAFLANISHETTGGWPTAPDGPFAWGLCFTEEVGCENNACPQYCDGANQQYPCAPSKTYHGRGPMQLSWNYNYGQAGDALGIPLLQNPDLLVTDGVVAFRTALWFWMTEQAPKPSCHDVMVGNWTPSAADEAMGRVPGFGMTINIINGGIECNKPTPTQVDDRVGFLMRYANMLGVDAGANLYCDQMASF